MQHALFTIKIEFMRKKHSNICHSLLALAALLLLATQPLRAGKQKEVYIPIDYSTCGYHASEQAIPDVRNVVYVECRKGDSYARLQRAINYVSSLKPDKQGHRGAVLLGEGTYYISQPLRITASGVVLRGAGCSKTVITKTGVDRGALLYIEGRFNMTGGDTIAVVDDKVPAGATTVTLADASLLKVGDRLRVVRPSTKEWIASLKCDDYGGGLSYTGWKAGDIDITWHRTVTAVEGHKVTLDAPITCSLSAQYGGAKVITGYNRDEIAECGVENLTLVAEHNAWNPMDEDHCWDGVWMEHVRDCWVRRVHFSGFAGSVVNVQKHAARITVEDCVADNPVSELAGWRRCVFLTRGEQTLIQRCVSRYGLHDFAAGFCAAGPNAFVQCEGESSLGFSGSVGSWATGLLFDIVNIEGHDISFKNLEQFSAGTGWNTANSMMWQCTASTLWNYSPDADNRNSANGCWATLTGDAEWTNSNNHVQPRSLFYDQLQKRVGERAINGYVLPRNTQATSSPTMEQAEIMARMSVEEPRLTLEMWIDSVPYTAEVTPHGLKDIDAVKGRQFDVPQPVETNNQYAVTNGHITCNGRLIVGNGYSIPWWNGRTKESFTDKSARPAITRFVPGREGTGLTDRLDSVVNYLDRNNYCMLHHHYGLWYDLRRTDHERIKRADGEVWAPFYEQAFSRTGQGRAWDGLSLYDLTKPNAWYWQRLNDFARLGAEKGILLFSENYFQHNIIEAGAHWVDCPWRPVNNVNATSFPEPVPFAGDKRVFMAEQFYNVNDPVLRPLHRQYIRQCLQQLKDRDNVVQLLSEEYTGPLHFTRFWLQTVAEWEQETGCRPMVALSCTKDAQDAILQDPELSKVVDIIDIRYWHYNTDSLWAPPAGKNLAPRQFMRKMKVGKTGFAEAYKAVKEYRLRYPDKAVTFYAQQYPQYGWAILMAGGSCPNVPVKHDKFLADVVKMHPVSGEPDSAAQVLGDAAVGYVVYLHEGNLDVQALAEGNYRLHYINPTTGEVKTIKNVTVGAAAQVLLQSPDAGVYWLEKR